MVKPRGKKKKQVLTVSSRSLREHGGNGAIPAPQKKRSAPQRARMYVFLIPTGKTLNKAYFEECFKAGGDSPEKKNAKDVPVHITTPQTTEGEIEINTRPSAHDNGHLANEVVP